VDLGYRSEIDGMLVYDLQLYIDNREPIVRAGVYSRGSSENLTCVAACQAGYPSVFMDPNSASKQYGSTRSPLDFHS
jgi:hypothetical protein